MVDRDTPSRSAAISTGSPATVWSRSTGSRACGLPSRREHPGAVDQDHGLAVREAGEPVGAIPLCWSPDS